MCFSSGPRADAFPQARRYFECSRASWLPQFAGQLAVIRDGALVGFYPDEQTACQETDMSHDDVFAFRVQSAADEDAYFRSLTVNEWACICEPFLDTDDPQGVWAATRILELRGYSRGRIRRLRLLSLTGLWWNAFAWEWEYLDQRHVLIGWALNCALIGPLGAAVAWFTMGPPWAIGTFAVGLAGSVLFARIANRGTTT